MIQDQWISSSIDRQNNKHNNVSMIEEVKLSQNIDNVKIVFKRFSLKFAETVKIKLLII